MTSCTKRDKILFFDHSMFMSGAEYSLLDILKGLKKKDFDFMLLAVKNSELYDIASAMEINTESIYLSDNLLRLGKKDIQNSLFIILPKIFSVIKAVVNIWLIIKRNKINVIYTNTLKSHLLGGAAGRLAGIKVIWHMRDIPMQKRPKKIMKIASVLLPHRIIAVSYAVKELFKGKKTTVIYNGIDVPEIQRKANDDLPENVAFHFNKNQKGPLIGIVGQIAKWKGQDVFLEAAKMLQQRIPDAKYYIIGEALFNEAEFKKKLINYIKTNDLDEKVIFTGNLKNVFPAIKNLDVLVHCSIEPEPFGRVLIEALALGIPIIATSGGGIEEVINNGRDGYIVQRNDPQKLAETIEKLWFNRKNRLIFSENGFKTVNNKFGFNKMINEIIEKINH